MKINFSKLKFNFNLSKKGEFKTVGIKAHHDWKVTVIVFFILSVAVVLGNMFLFVKLSKGEAFVKEGEIQTETSSESYKEIEEAVAFFLNHQKRLEELRGNKPTFSDPSL